MINEFRLDPIRDLGWGAAGLWRDDTGLAHPTMLVLDCSNQIDTIYDLRSAYDLPVVAIRQIDSFYSVRTHTNTIRHSCFRGWRFVSFETMGGMEAYLMIVWVER